LYSVSSALLFELRDQLGSYSTIVLDHSILRGVSYHRELSIEKATPLDFWGEIDLTGDRTPLVIVREQALLLAAKTNNVVEAKVTTSVSHDFLHHTFSLIVPALDGYTYELFSIRHAVEPYPVTIDALDSKLFSQAPSFQTKLKDEAEFNAWLQDLLSSARTKKIVSTLFSQVAA
jgi:hypothetical protein